MLPATFHASLIKPHFADGPNPMDDLLQAFDWNDLCRSVPGSEHLIIPIPSSELIERGVGWNTMCLAIPGNEYRVVSLVGSEEEMLARLAATADAVEDAEDKGERKIGALGISGLD